MKPGFFSFIGDEFENLLNNSDLFLPGIEKITGIYYSLKTKNIRIISRQNDQEVPDDHSAALLNRESMIMIQKFRQDQHHYTWIKKDELPFELPVRAPQIGNIFSELENIILVLRFRNDTDNLHDILFVYFNHNLGNFGLNRSDKSLTPDHKVIIGHLLYYQFKSILQINLSNRTLLRTLHHSVRSIIRENFSLKEQLQQVNASYSDSMVNLAIQHLKGHSDSFGKIYILADDAIEKLRGFKGNVKHIPAILENAIIFTENLLLKDDDGSGTIHAYCLDFESYQLSDKSEQFTRKIDSRQSRAMQLLDKLEKASISLKIKNISLISSSVAQALDPPVTAPAITDALNKNKEIIRQLLDKYPEKWEVIRNEFRPLLNMIRKTRPDYQKEESA